MKNGIKSTEFYAAIAGIGGLLFTFVQQNCAFTQDKIIGLVLLCGGYIASRTYLKGKTIDAAAVPPVVAKAEHVVVNQEPTPVTP